MGCCAAHSEAGHARSTRKRTCRATQCEFAFPRTQPTVGVGVAGRAGTSGKGRGASPSPCNPMRLLRASSVACCNVGCCLSHGVCRMLHAATWRARAANRQALVRRPACVSTPPSAHACARRIHARARARARTHVQEPALLSVWPWPMRRSGRKAAVARTPCWSRTAAHTVYGGCTAPVAVQQLRLAARQDRGRRHRCREGAPGGRDGGAAGRHIHRAAAPLQGTPQRRRWALVARMLHLVHVASVPAARCPRTSAPNCTSLVHLGIVRSCICICTSIVSAATAPLVLA